MCGKKFCLGRGLCKDSTNHAVIYCMQARCHIISTNHVFTARRVPFELRVNFDPTGGFPQEQHNKGFKLNFFQLPCQLPYQLVTLLPTSSSLVFVESLLVLLYQSLYHSQQLLPCQWLLLCGHTTLIIKSARWWC